jgi:hypothetical protein
MGSEFISIIDLIVWTLWHLNAVHSQRSNITTIHSRMREDHARLIIQNNDECVKLLLNSISDHFDNKMSNFFRDSCIRAILVI